MMPPQGIRHIWGDRRPVIIGMVHLLPLPGAPRWAGSLDEVRERALADARALEAGGVDGIIVENFGDAPFHPDAAPAETIAAMPTDVERIRAVKAAVPEATVWAGSGVDSGSIASILAVADGAIIGSAFQRGGRAGEPVEPERVRAVLAAAGRS